MKRPTRCTHCNHVVVLGGNHRCTPRTLAQLALGGAWRIGLVVFLTSAFAIAAAWVYSGK